MTSDGQEIVVNWLPLSAPNNGDSTVLSYNLVWDAGTGTTDQNVIGFNNMFTGTQISVTDNLVVGNPYKFRVRAKNIYGWSDFSDEAIIYAYDFPAQPAIMTTAVVGASIRFTFVPPNSNGSLITAY